MGKYEVDKQAGWDIEGSLSGYRYAISIHTAPSSVLSPP